MAIRVDYRSAALGDIVEAARQYEGRRTGFAAIFVAEIARIEALICDVPRLYPAIEGSIRRAVLRRFPFGLFYLEEPDRILVLACLDLRRSPEAITDILERR